MNDINNLWLWLGRILWGIRDESDQSNFNCKTLSFQLMADTAWKHVIKLRNFKSFKLILMYLIIRNQIEYDFNLVTHE